jgi:hypothetical protein
MRKIVLALMFLVFFFGIKSQEFENYYSGFKAQYSIHIGDSLVFVGGVNVINVFRKDGSFKTNKYVDGFVNTITECAEGKVYFAIYNQSSNLNVIPVYDGIDWTYITEEDGLPQNTSTFAIAFDSENNMWATLSSYNNHSQNFITKYDGSNWYTSGGVGDSIFFTYTTHIEIDEDDIVYVGTNVSGNSFNHSAFVVQINGSDTTCYSYLYDDFDIVDFHSSFRDTDNNIWFGGCYKRLARFDGSNWHAEAQHEAFSIGVTYSFYAISQDINGNMILGTTKGLFIEDDGDWTRYTVDDGMHYDYVIGLAVDDENNIWLASNSFSNDFSLMKFDGETFHSYFPNTQNSVKYDFSFYNDKVFAHGTFHNPTKLSILNDNEWNNGDGDIPFSLNIRFMIIDENETAWIVGQQSSNFYKWNLNDHTYEHIADIDGISYGLSLKATGYGDNVWLSFSNRIYKKVGDGWQEIEDAPSGSVSELKAKGSELWLLIDNILNRYDGTAWSSIDLEANLESTYLNIRDFAFHGDSIWLATSRGAVLIYDDEFSLHCNDSAMATGYSSLHTVHIDKNGLIWFGNSKGAMSYDGTDITYYQPFGVEETIHSIREDDNNNLWFAGSIAISKMSYEVESVDFEIIYSVDDVRIYPNPANSFIQIDLPENIDKDVLRIYTIIGSLVKSVELKQSSSIIDISDLPSGLYLLTLQSQNYLVKIIVE